MRIPIALVSSTVLGLTMLATSTKAPAQEFIAEDQDVTIITDDIWEHKITLTIAWSSSGRCRADPIGGGRNFKGEDCPLTNSRFRERHLSSHTIDRIDNHAQVVCDYYKRDAVGPLNISRPDSSPWRFTYTYACAIR